MLEAAGVPFEAVEASIDEDLVKAKLRARALSAPELALALAEAKAMGFEAEDGRLVLGSDQILELEDGSMLDKADSREELLDQLRRLSGRTHKLHAAACVLRDASLLWSEVETATMHVRPLGEAFLFDYVEREWQTVRWSVGGYHVEGRGAQLFERVEGSAFAVQGLPLLPLLAFLRRQGALLT